MARYKKRPTYHESLPGLFDDLENTLFPEAAPALPKSEKLEQEALKIIENEAAKAAREERRRQELFADGDDFTPLELSATVDKLNFISFGSGSSGNCAYIGDSESGLLIDAGVDINVVVTELKRNGVDMNSVKGIILTHDHSDHVRYVYAFAKRFRHIGVYCTPKALNGMLRRHSISNRIKDYHKPIYKEHPFKLGNFTVLAFEVSHDGTDNAGFFITNGGHAIAVATDLGCVSERADYYMRQANYIMIEANYDEHMLATGPYAEYLKARIRSAIGHLDNTVTAAYLASIYTPRLRNIFLCHLSKDNNTPAIAVKAVEDALRAAGLEAIGDCSGSPYARLAPVQLMALPRFESSGMIALRRD